MKEWNDIIQFTTDPVRKAEKINNIVAKDPNFEVRKELATAVEELKYFKSNRTEAETQLDDARKTMEKILRETDDERKKAVSALDVAHEDNKKLRVKVVEAETEVSDLKDEVMSLTKSIQSGETAATGVTAARDELFKLAGVKSMEELKAMKERLAQLEAKVEAGNADSENLMKALAAQAGKESMLKDAQALGVEEARMQYHKVQEEMENLAGAFAVYKKSHALHNDEVDALRNELEKSKPLDEAQVVMLRERIKELMAIIDDLKEQKAQAQKHEKSMKEQIQEVTHSREQLQQEVTRHTLHIAFCVSRIASDA